MFQIAGTFLTLEETGTSPSVVGTTKLVMPWRAGRTPVAMLVQMTGEAAATGRSRAVTPRRARVRR